MKKPGRIFQAKLLTNDVNPMFYQLKIAANEPYKREPLGTPHCDCQWANEAFFGIKITIDIRHGGNGGGTPEQRSYYMVPVAANKDGACVHCGYFASLQKPQNLEGVRNQKKALATRKVGKRLKVKGTHIETGEVVILPSEQKAYRAGYGRIDYALKHGTPTRGGWKWEKIENE